ncbi:MAG TPA: hypothetical protein VGN56_02915 [Candidatus Paceibacterota bacterium]|jgi:hypothetical protein|nr:hypothetical protein [Candidatus Paceibacterota bacterium]
MKNPLIQLALAFLLLVAGIGAYGIWFVAVDTENAHARDLAGQIQTKSQDATRIAEAKATLAALATDEASVGSHFVSTDDVVPFLSGLQNTGSALGSKVEVASVGAVPVQAGQGHLNLSLHITGTFDSVLRTLGALEYAPYDMRLTNLSLDTASKGVWSASASFSVGTGPASTTPAKPNP